MIVIYLSFSPDVYPDWFDLDLKSRKPDRKTTEEPETATTNYRLQIIPLVPLVPKNCSSSLMDACRQLISETGSCVSDI